MRLGFQLNLEQSQKLIMTPELRQAIQMLQFNSQELEQYLNSEMEINPLLEMEKKESNLESIDDYTNKIEEIDWSDYWSQYDDISYKNFSKAEDKKESFESYLSHKVSLKEHLLLQLNITIFNTFDKEIAHFIIESIDKNGYLKNDPKNIAKVFETSKERVENILQTIQTFDPVGIASRDLKECLRLQLQEKKLFDKNIDKIIDGYLEDVAKNRILKISKDLDISIKKAQYFCDIIKSLEPKPGRGFFHEDDEVKYITPDIYLHNIGGEYVIVLNDVTAPRLKINNFYKELLKDDNNENTSDFIKKKLNSAMWVIKSIEQRRMTIYKVVESIVKFQREFFDKGKKFLRPLTLKDIAEDIDVHESTVSRATNGKYIQTPRGLFELKFFFSSGVTGDDLSVASTGVKSMIKDLIEKEDPKKPISDQKIANILTSKDVNISRRTVAKYRDELGIPSSSGRRRY